MKLRINSIILLAYLLLLSAVIKDFLLVNIILLLIVVIFNRYINPTIENLLYIAIALSPFTPILYLFIFYLPFAVYGHLIESATFTKRYLFGYAISFFSAIAVYILSMLGIRIGVFLIFTAFFLPLLLVMWKIYRKSRNFGFLKEVYSIDPKELSILIVSVFFLFFVTGGIINNSNMYMSNGTYVYTKFLSVAEGIQEFSQVPQYEPRIAQGEHLFFTDTPLFYSNMAFASIIMGWIPKILFFNSATAFIMWLSILGAWQLIYEMTRSEKNGYMDFLVPMVGALSIVLSFMLMQLFESFKQSSAYPVNFLILSMVFAFPKKAKHIISIIALLAISFLIHGTQFIGFGQLAFFSFAILLLQNNPKEQISAAFAYAKKNKLKLMVFFILFLLLPLFYLLPGQLYKNYMRESVGMKINFAEAKPTVYSYLIGGLFFDKNTNPLSTGYPDLRRIDEKKFGFFFTYIGIASFFIVLLCFRKPKFRKTASFSFAYLAHFLVSSLLVLITFVAAAEYGYRTVLPFMLVVLVASIAALICSIPGKIAKLTLLLIFFSAFFHSAYYVRQNLGNIHSESIIAGETFGNEISVAKQLPIDGRIMTFGFYSNAVDMAMAALTDRYFSRYGFLQWNLEDNIYEKLTSLNSFGSIEAIEPMPGNQLANYLRIAGYKYLFLNVCHPAGALVLNKVYPDNAYPIHQNPNNKCFLFLGVNNANYAEKVDLVENIDEAKYNENDGYKYFAISKNKKVYNFNLEPYRRYTVKNPNLPEPLAFERKSPEDVTIYGDFKENEWVVFKEEHFPRWKAYMDGKEIPLLATNHRMMLMKTIEGNKINLKYSLLQNEKLAALLSLIAVIGLFFVLVIAI